jgi:two-component system cell cycle response regulator DivK
MDTFNLEGKKILIVEDDDMSFIFLNQIFKLVKGTIIRAKSGSEALYLFKNDSAIDLILMDIQLPDINGNSVTSQIRKIDKNIPIIAQTAGRTPQDIDTAFDAGSSEVLTKPFSMEKLIDVLKKYV